VRVKLSLLTARKFSGVHNVASYGSTSLASACLARTDWDRDQGLLVWVRVCGSLPLRLEEIKKKEEKRAREREREREREKEKEKERKEDRTSTGFVNVVRRVVIDKIRAD